MIFNGLQMQVPGLSFCKATQRIRPDTVYMVYGFGHTRKAMTNAYMRGASATQLATRYVTDPLMGGTSIHSNFVTFVKEA